MTLGALAVLLLGLVWWATVWGVPGALLVMITDRIQDETGVAVKVDRAVFRNDRLVELRGLTVHDGEEVLMLHGDRVIAEFPKSGWRGLPELTLLDGAVVYGAGTPDEIDAPLSHARITPLKKSIRVAAAGRCGALQLDLRVGLIGTLPKQAKKRKRFRLKRLQADGASGELIREIHDAIKCADRGSLRCRIDVFLPKPSQSRGTVDLQISDCLVRGIALQNLQFGASSLGGHVQGDYAVTADGGQQVSGSFELGKDMVLSTRLAGAVWPTRWLTAVGQKLPLAELEFHDLVDVRGNCSWPIRGKWGEISADASVRTSVTVRDARFSNFGARLMLEDGVLRFADARGFVNGDGLIKAHGQFDLDTRRIYVGFEATADPLFVRDISGNKPFRRDFAQLMSMFEFAPGQYPSAEGELYACPEWPRGGLIMNLKASGQNVRYMGTRLDRASAELLVDVPDALVLIDNLSLSIGRKEFSGRLAREFRAPHIDRPRAMEFRAQSNLPSDELFRVITLGWGKRQTAKGRLAVEAEAVGRGRVYMDSQDHDVDVRYRTPRFQLENGESRNLTGELRVRGREVTTQNHAESIRLSQWELGEADLDFCFKPGAPSLSVKAKEAVRGDLAVEELVLDGVYDPEDDGRLLGIDVRSKALKVAEIRVANAECAVRFQEEGFTAKVHGESAAIDRLQAGEVEVELTQKGNALVGALKLASIQCDEVTAEAISGTLERKKTEDGEVFHFAGTSGAWALTAPETTGSEATLKGAFAADGWALDAGFDHAVFMAEGKMQGAVVRLDQRGKQPLALALTSDAFTWGDWTLTGTTAQGTVSRDATRLHVTAESVAKGATTATGFSGVGAWSDGDLSLVNATAGFYGGELRGDFFMNVPAERGTTFWVMRDVDVNQLNKALKPDKATKVKEGEKTPTLTARANVSMNGWGETLTLSGSGQLNVVDGNFVRYRIPILSDFLVAVSKARILGLITTPISHMTRISTLSTDVEFVGTKMKFQSLRTNGEVIAVAGRGYYDWKEPWLDVRLHAESLPGLWKRLPLVDDPFKIVLARRATGTFSDPKWEEISGLRDFFRDTEKDMN